MTRVTVTVMQTPKVNDKWFKKLKAEFKQTDALTTRAIYLSENYDEAYLYLIEHLNDEELMYDYPEEEITRVEYSCDYCLRRNVNSVFGNYNGLAAHVQMLHRGWYVCEDQECAEVVMTRSCRFHRH